MSELIWEDDCQGLAGTPPDPWAWGLKVTDQWQPANELQNYTTNAVNAKYNGQGQLVITAIKESSGGKPYSSAKLSARHSTQGDKFRFGLFEARIKVPTAIGVWPAFWLLGEDNPYGWPYCGEIDVMECPVIAGAVRQTHQGTHSPSVSGADIAKGVVPTSGWSNDYHTYSVDWRPDSMEFYVDHQRTGLINRSMVEAVGGVWPFNHRPQSPILNLAVGGWAGTPDPAWTSQSMMVDWVRIYA
jgi:beta-glucanase (GH16 family)